MHRLIREIPEATIAVKRDDPALRTKHFRVNHEVPQMAFAPLEIVQIDHKRLDFECVDAETRMPCGRLWLTLVVDCYTAAVIGFYLSFDDPSSIAIARALLHAATPKQAYLEGLGIRGTWPMHGIPGRVYSDNGSDFTSKAIREAFARLGKNPPMFRPKGQPHYGGLVERVVGLAGEQFNGCPGDTGSSIARKGKRDPSRTAAYTIEACEKILANYFANIYNTKRFSKTTSPLYKWLKSGDSGTFNDRELSSDELKELYITFLPTFSRKVKQYGVRIENSIFSDDFLNLLIQNPDEEHIFHFDNKDIRCIYYFDVKSASYVEIKNIIPELPATSAKSYNAKLKQMRKDSDALFNPEMFRWAKDFADEITKQEVSSTRSKKSRIAKEKARRTERPRSVEQLNYQDGQSENPEFEIEMDEPDGIYQYV
jgi:putative transposase